MNNNKILSLEEQRKIQLNGLLYIKDLCEKNNIPYYLISGTLLGAVKYKGYIPWDDDIDIALIREDYLKLISIIEQNKNPDYEILTMYNTKDYYYSYAKLVNTQTKLTENAKEIKKMGVFIDIFPLDYADDEVENLFKKTRFIRNLAAKRMKIKNSIQKTKLLPQPEKKIKNKFIKDIIYNIVDIMSLPLGYQYWVKKLDKIISKKRTGKYLGYLYKEELTILNCKLFKEYDIYEFEGYNFTSIKNSDKYLKETYGDYWLDPPKEKQRSHHQLTATWRDK